MDIHGRIPTQFFICDPGTFRDINQHAVANAVMQNHVLGQQKSRDSLNLRLISDPVPECLTQSFTGSGNTPVLGSPELNLLKLESPELERLIMAQHGENSIHPLAHKDESAPSLMAQLEMNSNRNLKAISPLISNDDYQFITETNQALDSIIPKSHCNETLQHSSTDSFVLRMESLLEPLQQVPGNHESTQNLIPRKKELEQSMIDAKHSVQRKRMKNYRMNHTLGSGDLFRTKKEQLDMEYEKIVKSDGLFEGSSQLSYDINQPTMVANPYAHNALEKDTTSGLAMLPVPAIDLEVQEIVKRERKKLKNRVAASKCRKKKLEREAQLEVRVQHLKEKNIELNALANALRQQAGELKQRIMEHVNSGCPGRLLRY